MVLFLLSIVHHFLVLNIGIQANVYFSGLGSTASHAMNLSEMKIKSRNANVKIVSFSGLKVHFILIVTHFQWQNFAAESAPCSLWGEQVSNKNGNN